MNPASRASDSRATVSFKEVHQESTIGSSAGADASGRTLNPPDRPADGASVASSTPAADISGDYHHQINGSHASSAYLRTRDCRHRASPTSQAPGAYQALLLRWPFKSMTPSLQRRWPTSVRSRSPPRADRRLQTYPASSSAELHQPAILT